MPKFAKWILLELVIFAVVFTGVLAIVVLVIQPNITAYTNMPKEGKFTINQLESGELEIVWPKADQADYYLFQIYQLPNDGQLSYQNDAGELVYEVQVTKGNRVVLPHDAFSGKMLFKVRSAVTYTYRGVENIRYSETAVETVTRFEPPMIENVSCQTNVEKQTATIRLELFGGTTCNVSIKDASGKLKPLTTISGDTLTISFGEEGDLPMPGFGENVQLHFMTYREEKNVVYYSTHFMELTIDRSMLVPADILLESEYSQDGCHIRWEEEECDYYEIQRYVAATQGWEVIGIVNGDEERTFLLTDLQEDSLQVIRVAAAYEKEQKNEEGQMEIVVKYRSISNELGVGLSMVQPENPEQPEEDV